MSVLGQERRFEAPPTASGLPQSTDIIRPAQRTENLDAPDYRHQIDDATPIALSKGEYALLLAFLEAPQRPLSREHLLQATRIHEDIFDRSIDVQVLRLRRKLETDPSAPRVIQTERGVGYVFALPVQPV